VYSKPEARQKKAEDRRKIEAATGQQPAVCLKGARERLFSYFSVGPLLAILHKTHLWNKQKTSSATDIAILFSTEDAVPTTKPKPKTNLRIGRYQVNVFDPGH
jgi:hypothetical protein